MFMKTSELISITWPKFTKNKGTILYKESAIDKNEVTNVWLQFMKIIKHQYTVAMIYENKGANYYNMTTIYINDRKKKNCTT